MNAVELGPIWPSATEIVRMGLEDRGDLLLRLEARLREISWDFCAGEYIEFLGEKGIANLQHEQVQVDELLEVIRKVGFLIPGEPE